MQSSECDERIESFASPPYFITLLNFKGECILHGSTVEPRHNEGPRDWQNYFVRYNEVSLYRGSF